jgi:hypothetical protein
MLSGCSLNHRRWVERQPRPWGLIAQSFYSASRRSHWWSEFLWGQSRPPEDSLAPKIGVRTKQATRRDRSSRWATVTR